jgi:voltage-gated potassium channel
MVLRAGQEPPNLGALLLRPVAVVAALFTLGVVGYGWIEGWSALDAVWMVGITVSTIGYGEARPLSDAGRVFTLGLIAVSGLVAATELAAVAVRLGEDGLVGALRLRRWKRELMRMKDHAIVIGYGRLGREISLDLLHHGLEVVVIDLVAPVDPPPEGLRLLVGDAAHEAVLEEAGVGRARAVAIATPSDAVNVYLTLTVRQLAPAVTIVTRIEEDTARAKALRAGANHVVQPFNLSGSRMSQALLRPGASGFVDRALDRRFADLGMDDVTVPPGSPALGRMDPSDLRLRFGVVVVAVAPAGAPHATLAQPGDPVREGDVWVVIGGPEQVQKLAAWVAGPRRAST